MRGVLWVRLYASQGFVWWS